MADKGMVIDAMPAVIVGAIFTLLVIYIAFSNPLTGTSQAQSEGITAVENLRESINSRCNVIVKQSRENYQAENYTFQRVSSIDISGETMIVDKSEGGSLRYSLEDACSYSWNGIQPGQNTWGINVSAVNTNNPEIQIQASQQ